MDLTEDDVLEILKLFEQSKFDYLHLEQGGRKITVSKGGYVPAHREAPAAHIEGVAARTDAAPSRLAPPPTVPEQSPKPDVAVAEEGLVAITAPMMGKFYAAPSPSEPPFVAVGGQVAAGATLGLIEVMKVFTSVKTEIAGLVERILVTNGQSVEYGQALFLIRPDSSEGTRTAL